MKSLTWIYALVLLITVTMFGMQSHAGVGVVNKAVAGYQTIGVANQLVCQGGISCQKQNATGQISVTLSQIPYSAAGITRFTSQWTPPTLTGGTVAPGIAGNMFLTQIHIVHSVVLTGIQLLNGTPCGTDKWQVALYDYSGKRLAQSAIAGVTCSGVSVYQLIPFTAAYTATYPGTYWIGLISNGTTDKYAAMPAVSAIGGLAGSVTGQTFGALSTTVVLPTTFTADKGPIAGTY